MADVFRAVWICIAVGACSMPNAGPQPRALLWGAAQPACIFWCNIQIEVINAEGDTTRTTGAVSQTRTQTGGAQSLRESLSVGARPTP